MSMLLTSVAYAQEAGAAEVPDPSPFAGILPIVLMVVLFYFLLVRPQQKKMGEHKKMISALRRGDKIVTSGGIYGSVSKVEDDVLHVEIAPDVKVKLDKNMVSLVLTRSEPADTKTADSKSSKTE